MLPAVTSFVNGHATEEPEACCNIRVGPPTDVQPGDVFIVILQALENGQRPTPTAPSGWQPLTFTNLSSTSIVSDEFTSWVFAHVYSSSDPATYPFSVANLGGGEFETYFVSYRNASQNLNAYTLYGYADMTSTAALPNVPANMTLLNVFQAVQTEVNEDDLVPVTFSIPAGTPTLTVETPRSVVFPYLAADVPTGTGGTFGSYSTNDNYGDEGTTFQVLVPSLTH